MEEHAPTGAASSAAAGAAFGTASGTAAAVTTRRMAKGKPVEAAAAPAVPAAVAPNQVPS